MASRKHPDGSLPIRHGWLLGLLVVMAALPRFANLDHLSFYGDEKTSAPPARALAEGRGPIMPSGMEYRRGLLATVLSATSARIIGVDRDISYRIPSALFGTLTVPLLFLVGRRYVSTDVALVTAVALALSEWHLVYSRMARMYGPALFFYLLAAYTIWSWADRGGGWRLALAALAFVATVTSHTLGMTVVVFALIPVVLPRETKASPLTLTTFAAVGGATGWLYRTMFVGAPYRIWTPVLTGGDTTAEAGGTWQVQALSSFLEPDWLVVTVGLGLGIWAGVRALETDHRTGELLRSAGLVILGGGSGALLAAGQFWGGGALMLILLVTHPGNRPAMLKRAWPPVGAAFALGMASFLVDVASLGAGEAVRQALVFPFPFLYPLLEEMPGAVLLFVVVWLWAAARPCRSVEFGVRGAVLGALALLLAVGVFRRWGPLRYVFFSYPFLLLAASAGLVMVLRRVRDRVDGMDLPGWSVAAAGVAIVLSGVLGGHGIVRAVEVTTLEHGEPVPKALHIFPIRPDHRGAGEYLRRQLRPEDVIIAENPLHVHWYTGQADFWFRALHDARQFLYEARDGSYRDIYVGSALLTRPESVDSIARATEGRTWLVTSGETRHNRDWYLDPDQQAWLDSLEASRDPAFTARDGATRVYCLDCPLGPSG